MERITVTIESQIAAKLRREARRRHISLSELIRERIGHGNEASARRTIPWAGIGASENPRLATDMDAELDRTWPEELRKLG